MDTPHFPLLRLPRRAMSNVVKLMGFIDIIAYSLSSKKSRYLVEALKLEARVIRVFVSNNIEIEINFPNDNTVMTVSFHWNESQNWIAGNPLITVGVPANMSIHYDTVENNALVRMEERQWHLAEDDQHSLGFFFYHFGWIFKNMGVDRVEFQLESQRFNIEDIKREIEGSFNFWIFVRNECENEHHRQIHRVFQPIDYLGLQKNPYDEFDAQRLIIQNFNALRFEPGNTFTLSDLLTTNSLHMHISVPDRISLKDINRYLKLWQAGTTSSRLIHFTTHFPPENILDSRNVLKGVTYVAMGDNLERTYKNVGLNVTVRGGYDIRNKKGIFATITFELEVEGDSNLKMYVWS